MSISKNLEKVLLRDIAADSIKKSLDPDENLLEQGMIDSLGLMKLIAFMEKTFSIKITDQEIFPENFQSINSMVRLVEQKMQTG